MDKNRICNMTLGVTGHGKIVDINDGSPKANACLLYFEQCAEILLAYYNWSFARKLKDINLYSKSYPGYKYAYIYPDDCIAARKYLDEDGEEVDVKKCKNILSSNNAMRLILSNYKLKTIEYTARMLNTEMWTGDFIEAFNYLHASKVIAHITGEKEEKKYNAYLSLREAAAANDQYEDSMTYDTDIDEDYVPLYDGVL